MGGLKLLLASAAVLLAIGLAACGDGDDPTSTTGPADSKSAQKKSKPANDDAQGKSKKDGDERKSGSSKKGSSETLAERGKDIGNFVPKQHEDTGGGAEQFQVKGGDNSVQEFGEEADDSDFEEASTVLHNFLDARAIGDWTAVCEYLAADVLESLETFASNSKGSKGASCGELLGGYTNKAVLPLLRKEAEKADVGSLRFEGDQAFIIYRGLDGDILTMSMTKEEDGWKVASLGGVPLN